MADENVLRHHVETSKDWIDQKYAVVDDDSIKNVIVQLFYPMISKM